MKIQVSFDFTDLSKAIDLAESIREYFDILDVGTLLIYKYGDAPIRTFKEKFPQKIILADAKLVDQGQEALRIFADAGADWITVMAGANSRVIHKTAQEAHKFGKKVILDLSDASSVEQSALEAKNLGADGLLFCPEISQEDPFPLKEKYEIVKGNTQLPVFVTISKEDSLKETLSINPSGIAIGSVIIKSENPVETAAKIYKMASRMSSK